MKQLWKWKVWFIPAIVLLLGITYWSALATDLETTRINSQDRIQFALDKITQDITSTLYDGGGTSNALQVDVDTDAIIASGAAVIDAGGANAIDVWLSNPSAVQNATFYVAEFSAATPTAITCIRITEVAIPDADRTVVIDRANWGLTVATDHYVKLPVRIAVTPGSYLMMGMAASEGGTWYARYTLLASMDTSRADVNTNIAGDLATITTAIASLSKTEDSGHTTADTGVMLLTVRDDTPPAATGANGDYVPLLTNATGNLYVADETAEATLTNIETAVQIIDNNVLASKTLLRHDFLNTAVANGAFYAIAPDPAAATKVYVVELSITQTVQGLTEVRDTDNAGDLLAQWYFASYGGICLQMSQQAHFVAVDANEPVGLVNETGSTCGYAGHVVYYLE